MRGACVEGLRDMQPTKNVERIMIHEAPHLIFSFFLSIYFILFYFIFLILSLIFFSGSF
jgi:hypothetical protein